MKIIVVSDTHGSYRNFKHIMELHKDADIVVHCGDCRSELEEIKREYPDKEYHAVRGNCDFDSLLQSVTFFTADGVKFMVTHGHMFNVKFGLGTLERAAREEGADVVCFGHTHIPHDEYIDGIRLFNPGAAGGKQFGIIEIKDGQVLSSNWRLK